MSVISTFGGMSARGFGLLSSAPLRPATSFITVTASTTTNVVPLGYNAVHIQAAVGGGGGGIRGASYDKAGGESAGAGGGSGAYISDKIFTVSAGETLTFVAGALGAADNTPGYNQTAGNGVTTTLSGSITGSIFSLAGGGGSSGFGGSVFGPLRTNVAGTAGSATISGTAITSGQFKNPSNVVVSVTTNTSGPVGTFNQSGNGAAGTNPGNCGGDNCQIGGGNGGASYAGNIVGGAGSPQGSSAQATAGTRGSGGGGGGAQVPGFDSLGNSGGNGEVIFRFLQVKQ